MAATDPSSPPTEGLDSVPVAPGRLPLLGHLVGLTRDRMEFLESLRVLGPLVRVYFGTLPVYVLTDTTVLHQVLVEQGRCFEKGKLFDEMRPLLGNGLGTSERELHRRQRRLIQQVFHRDRIAAYATIMSAQAQTLADSWRPSQRLQVDQVMIELTLTTLMRTIFSGTFAPATVMRIHRMMRTVVRGILARTVTPKPLLMLTGADRRFTTVARRLRVIVDDLIAGHQVSDAEYQDLLAVLLAARDPETGEPMDAVLVCDELISFVIAGTETTANALTWVFHELGGNPAVEQRLHAEIDAEIGGRPVTHDDLDRLPYTRAVVTEILRLYALPILMRRAVSPAVVGHVDMPPGTEVLFSLAALHRDPEAFPDPHQFDPGRWLPGNDRQPPRGCFLPFGSGARQCIGDTFAVTEMMIAVATIAARWQLRPPPGSTVRAVAHATLHPNRLPMTAVPRHP